MTAYYAVVCFIHGAGTELIALSPMSAPTKYAALRQACFSIAGGQDNTAIVGAFVFAKERDENGVMGDIAIVTRYGETPEVMTGIGRSLTGDFVARQSAAVESAKGVVQIIRERWHQEMPGVRGTVDTARPVNLSHDRGP